MRSPGRRPSPRVAEGWSARTHDAPRPPTAVPSPRRRACPSPRSAHRYPTPRSSSPPRRCRRCARPRCRAERARRSRLTRSANDATARSCRGAPIARCRSSPRPAGLSIDGCRRTHVELGAQDAFVEALPAARAYGARRLVHGEAEVALQQRAPGRLGVLAADELVKGPRRRAEPCERACVEMRQQRVRKHRCGPRRERASVEAIVELAVRARSSVVRAPADHCWMYSGARG